MSSFGGNSSNHGNNRSGDSDDEGWGSKFFKAVSAAAATAVVAGGLYALLTSSSSTPNSEAQHSPYESRASRVIKEPDDDDRAWSLHHNDESIPSSQNIRWTKPEIGWVKLNVDGSHDHIGHPRSSSYGGVLRNSSGEWLLGFSQKLDPSFEVHETELEAILKGLELAFNRNDIDKLVLESDNKSAVSMVENGLEAKYNHPQFNIVSRIRDLRFDPKWEVKVVHVPREANKVANRLAKDARDLPSQYLRKYPYPPANCATLVEEDAHARVFYPSVSKKGCREE